MVSPDEEKEEGTQQVLPGYNTIEEFSQAGFKAVMEATKFSNKLPSGRSWDMYNAYPSFQKIMNTEGRRILEIMNMVLSHQGIRGNIVMRDIEEKFDLLVDCNDTVLERVSSNLDEISGIRQNPETVVVESTGSTTRVVSGSWNRKSWESTASNKGSSVRLRLLAARNVERPQLKFKDRIDNSPNPFEPRITDKPNSLKPLSILLEVDEHGECYSHPYEYELDLFKPSENQLTKVEPKMYRDLNETPLVMINTPDDISVLLADLKKYKEIAVDLEHHSYRTFQGITCLMQISTRDTDYIIDTLELRDKLEVLNEVFTDPKIVKVFHGAECDIDWLQRDLSIYVVNMFDTYFAARMLDFVHLSLAYLLKYYCNIVLNKQFQLADWRIRPLPDELIKYAREDTHYLLYVYDSMKNALIDKGNGLSNILLSVLEQSRDLCKKRYVKPICNEDSHLDLYRKNKKMFDNRQMYAFRELFFWRNKTAREEDESLGYVLPNHMLLSIAEVLPREMQGILALCNPTPPLVRQNLVKLHQMVLKAREESLTRPILEDEARLRPIAQVVWNKLDLDSPLYCPHDMKYRQDFREDLPTVLDSLGQSLINTERSEMLQNTSPHITLFDRDSESEQEDHGDNDLLRIQARGSIFVSPYERYKSARPFIEAQEKKRRETLEAQEKKDAESKNGTIKAEENIAKKEEDIEIIVPFNKQIAKGKNRKKGKKRNINSLPNDSTPEQNSKNPRLEENSVISPSTSTDTNLRKRGNESKETVNPPKKIKFKHDKEIQPDQSVKKNDFDYNQVDFSNQFQGGSKQNNPKGNKKGKMKPKGKKKRFIGKTNHKSLTFGTKGR